MTHYPLHSTDTIIAPVVPGGGESIKAQRRRLDTAFAGDKPGLHRYLLVLRFSVINMVGFALLGGAYWQGWVAVVFRSDITGLSFAIFAVFVVGLVMCGAKVWQASAEINRAKVSDQRLATRVGRYLREVHGRDANSRALSASALRLKLFSRIAVVRQIANTLVVLGLIGTVNRFTAIIQAGERDAVD